MTNVTIYTTPTCGYCHKSKEFFKEHNIKYTEKDVTKDQAALNDMMQKSGSTSVPVIDVDGEIIVGFDEGKLKKALNIAS
ncbi:MAG: NrdH-redoxin [Nanoarchaeota archaeon]|nr:NrdH-redoxin [Nanoarchaeota archaeon]|tara:strand:+ start:647 stop:886 length:240 start_codon:yes stop_codon:yes gene_type:complete